MTTAHEAQVALLGSALNVRPGSRRHQQLMARQRFEKYRNAPIIDLTDSWANARTSLINRHYTERKALADRAVFYTDMTARDAAQALGISYDKMRKLVAEFGLNFKPGGNGQERKNDRPARH